MHDHVCTVLCTLCTVFTQEIAADWCNDETIPNTPVLLLTVLMILNLSEHHSHSNP